MDVSSSPANEASDHRPAELYNAYLGHAHRDTQLTTARLNALLSSQSFLTIAYATSMGAANGHWTQSFELMIPPVLAVLGLLLALAGRLDIEAATRSAARWLTLAATLKEQHPQLKASLADGDVAEAPLSRR